MTRGTERPAQKLDSIRMQDSVPKTFSARIAVLTQNENPLINIKLILRKGFPTGIPLKQSRI
jgi:hypothetical protein